MDHTKRRARLIWIPVLLLFAFQILMVTKSNMDSGGIVYYLGYDSAADITHTMSATVGQRLAAAVGLLIAIEAACAAYCIRRNVSGAVTIMVLVAILLTVGLCYQTYTLPPNGSMKHCKTILTGGVALSVGMWISRVATRLPQRYRNRVLWAGIIGMTAFVAVASVYGKLHTVNGAGGVFLGLTTSDLYKLFVILFLSLSLPELQLNNRLRLAFFLLCLVMVGTMGALNNLGDAIILSTIVLVAVLQSLGTRTFFVTGTALAAAAVGAYSLIRARAPDSYIVTRVRNTFVASTDATVNTNYRRSVLAVMYRGVYGSGTGDTRLVANNFASQNDYAYSGLTAIFGLSIALLVLVCIALLPITILLRTKECSRDPHLYSFASLAATLLLSQGILHIGSDLNILPLTGVTLPFISMGGTAMATAFLSVGLAVGRRLPQARAVHLSMSMPQMKMTAMGEKIRSIWTTLRRRAERRWAR